MSLPPGTRIGGYEVTGQLGAGGMGEVYRAKDSKLKREVALKVLPADVANDRERMARFQREAEVLASLNHPHIAQIYGIEESAGPAKAGHHIGAGVASGFSRTTALVMELVEGEDLAARLKRGAIPIDEALPIAKQIAEALEAAHEQGIIHRDLKPANIKVRPDGTVKVLDFGLAKALEPGVGNRESGTGNTLANSPTITSPAMTMHGMILGTAAYMAPEQAKGKVVDKRADIWAFGVVLYEMLSGTRAFGGEDTTDTIAAVITRDPDWSRLPPATPATVHRLLARCLTKDRKHRLRDIGDAHHELVDDGPVLTASVAPAPRLPWYAAAAGFAAAALLAVPAISHWREARIATAALRLTIDGPAGSVRLLSPEISADGRTLAFASIASGAAAPQLWIRRLDEPLPRLTAPPLNPTGPPFWSPAGDALAVPTREGLLHLDLSTGGTRVLAGLRSTMVGMSQFGGTWGRDQVLLYSIDSRLFRVSERGGDEAPVVLAGLAADVAIRFPVFLPDGRRFLFLVRDQDQSHLYAGSIDGGPVTRLFPSDSQGVYTEPSPGAGYVLHVVDDNLVAQPFDLAGLRPLGSPYVVAPRVPLYTAEFIGTGRAGFAVSADGVLVYASHSDTLLQRLVWLNRAGEEIGTIGEPALYFGPRISPDGRRVAVARLDPKTRLGDIYVLADDGPAQRLTFDDDNDLQPVWTPDGQHVIWGTQRRNTSMLVRRRADGSGTEEILHRSEHPVAPDDVSPDGRHVVFRESHPVTRNDLWILPLDGRGEARPVLNTSADEPRARFSPDGRLIGYISDASGRVEGYVQPFPDMSGKWQVSDGAGNMPQWRRDGREIYFSSGSTLWARPVMGTNPLQLGQPVALFTPPVTPRGSFFHVDAVGQRFLFAPERSSPDLVRFHIAIGWMKPQS